ncbi:MAG: glucoamylase family protein [Xanthomonadales bacterium]|nr:glucoamylase family protein [Xanthomonadales bacterium]
MSARPDIKDGATVPALDTEASAVAASQRNVRRAVSMRRSRFTLPPFRAAFERDYRYLAARNVHNASLQRPTEWFLDNYYIIRRVARQVGQDLPPGFVRRLPVLATGPEQGLPRIDALAREFIARKSIELDHSMLDCFVSAYQKSVPLSIAELWALPTMLRAAVLSSLLSFLAELQAPGGEQNGVAVSRSRDQAPDSNPAVDPSMGVERSIRELRLLAEMDWQVFFEEHSCVEAVLRSDPAKVYPLMDFDTCDDYRKAVEDLAWNTGVAEEEVARQAVVLASNAAGDPRRGHLGFYLVGEGRSVLEAQIGFYPRGIERLRRLVRRFPTIAYLLPLTTLTAGPLLLAWWYAAYALHMTWSPLSKVGLVLACMLAAPPLWSVSAMVLQRLYAKLLPPRRLPKLDYSNGVPNSARSLVVIPTQFARAEDVQGMLQQLELHYLSNPDPMLGFALLTDYLDATEIPVDGELLESAAEGIVLLNNKHGDGATGPFLLLHREPRWNPAEGQFMGWERKRGKLEELNRRLRGDKDTSFVRRVGDHARLEDIRFVITLDSDTELPLGAAQRLIGLLAHPLNRATFDARTGRVLAGYTVVQPRLETSPTSALTTLFAQIFAGNAGLDIYTHASSELYQDLFGSGIYCGKGIYDVDSFTRSLKGRVPENTLASHDLFEGMHGRTALASDIVLYEQYPSHYASFCRRMHRWVRGDWQLWPWLLPRVPSTAGSLLRNRLAPIDRWKILDNLRRSIVGPCLCVLLVAGWTVLPLHPLLTTLSALAILLAPLMPAFAEPRRRREALARCVLAVVFMLHEATVVVDAIARVLVRTTITRRNLLQWTSAANTALGYSNQSLRRALWREMFGSPMLAVGITALVIWLRPAALIYAAPVLIVWALAPEIARWVSKPRPQHSTPLAAEEEKRLRLLSRRTWLFFETFVGPADQWLPIDNYQEVPREQTAHRTSPTNIGLMLISTLSAYDLGYIGPSELALRLRRSFDSIGRLSHYRGHLLNWYETKNLEPLLPRYVSTVDSGNFAGCLLALKKGCHEVAQAYVIPAHAWRGLGDSLALVEASLITLEAGADVSQVSPESKLAVNSLRAVLTSMHAHVEDNQDVSMSAAYATLMTLCDETLVNLNSVLLSLLQTGVYRHETDHLRSLRTAMGGLEQHLHQLRREIDSLIPWLSLTAEPASRALDLSAHVRLNEIPATALRLGAELATWESEQRRLGQLTDELEDSASRLREAFERGGESARALQEELTSLANRADREAYAMDFRLLFDGERKLFHIGYNVTADLVDPHYYDLLASEARLASYFAIIKRDVPESHWYALGRPMTVVAGGPALLSWGGTIFEYLMPSLLMRSRQGTLLQQSAEFAVKAQVAYGEHQNVPWGISESSYARLDAHETYQYRSFGVPGLGFKRDLEDDLVVAPYASVLAMSILPKTVVDNVARFESMGMGGIYGLFEAIDFRPDSLLETETTSYAVVRSYMAHHQGMVLVALNNYFNQQIMVDRFHAEPSVGAGEMLLNERAPTTAPAEWPLVAAPDHHNDEETATPLPASTPWTPEAQGRPQAFVFGNGRLSTILTDRGGGGLRWQGLALTRYQPDPTCDGDGIWFYVHDKDRGNTWLATSEQGRTTYAALKAKFHQRDHGISVHVAIAVAPADDVELRRVTLHNETDRPRRLSLTSAGEPVLLKLADAASHPAFARMFIESKYVAELDALVFTRRPRSDNEGRAVLVHRLVSEGKAVKLGGYQTDRSDFFGRCRSVREPRWLEDSSRTDQGRVGTVIDPLMALTADVMLAPNQSVTFAFVTTVARSQSAAVALAAQYGTMQAVRWSFQDAQRQSAGRLARAGINPSLLPPVQRLFSALLFVDPTFREAPAASPNTATPRPRKNAFWGQGISGDLPLVVTRVADPGSMLVQQLVLAQRYLRSCGFAFDIIMLDAEPSGYFTEGVGTLHHALAQVDLSGWLNKRGGVHLLSVDQLNDDACRRLVATARVVLDTRNGTLSDQMSRHIQRPPVLPRFEPTSLQETVSPPVSARPTLLFDNGLGGFSEDGREYIISVRPGHPTPAPWCNVLANPEFGCIVSESSLGSTWSANAGENRLTPWRNDPVFDTPAEVLYLRDEETSSIWSATPLPAGGEVETRVHHGAGYTTYVRESHGLQQELTIFVPPNAPLKVARLRLKNMLPRHRRLTATYYVEWVLGSLHIEQSAYVESELEPANACLLATCDWNAEFAGRVAFLAAERDLHGFTTDRTEFLGRSGSYALPDALTRWGLSGRIESSGDPCGALQVHFELDAAGELNDEIVTHFVLGQASTRADAIALVGRFRRQEVIDAAWKELGTFWDDLLGCVRVKTPEPAMDLLLNRWLQYQNLSSRIFGRTAFYQSSGAFGFRDQLQDVLALMHAAPARARAHILEAAAHQFEEGDVLHWWHPPSGRGVRTRCSDDMAWLPYVTACYVSATGDGSILAERVHFLKGEPLADKEHDRYAEYAQSEQNEPLMEHCRRALHRALTSGTHGLPLMAGGDWNDGMNQVGAKGRGESVWLAWFLCATMNRFADICERSGSAAGEAAAWRARSESLRAAIEANAWDGAWYLRAFHDDGSLVGSKSARECTIDSIAQSWAVLSGVGDPERAIIAMRAADEQLVHEQDRLILLLRPPFDVTVHDPGYIRSYPPGVRENGGQYTHAATWLGWAYAAQGDGQNAARVFNLINPILRTQTVADSERYRAEPYVLTGDVYSSAPWVGRGGWSWYTGSAAWAYRLGIEAILGLRKQDGHLFIDPCIPPEWNGFEAWIRVGAEEVHIVVENPHAVSRGVASITLNGTPLASNRIESAAISTGGPHEVWLRLGSESDKATIPGSLVNDR